MVSIREKCNKLQKYILKGFIIFIMKNLELTKIMMNCQTKCNTLSMTKSPPLYTKGGVGEG